jgi:outer membrane receptor protein involved in Fe transport
MAIDADWSHSRARFIDGDPAGPFIPGALAGVGSLGVTLIGREGWSGGLHARYVGARPLVEDGSVSAQPFTLVDLRLSWRLNARTTLMLDALNLTNRSASDMVYWYRSRLAGEPASGVNDVHLHPAEPRTVRLSLRIGFP